MSEKSTEPAVECRWCRFSLDECICYSPDWKYARQKYQLTGRECTILDAFIETEGTAKHVARKLGLSNKTVEIHLHLIKRKMGVTSKIRAILNWVSALQEYQKMASEQVKPVHPLDIFELPSGVWYYRVDLGQFGIRNVEQQALLWPHGSPQWALLVQEQEKKQA